MSINPFMVPAPPKRDNWLWATVTQLSPLRVRFDGEAAAVDATVDTLVDPVGLIVGSRVWVQIFGNSMVIVGVAGGVDIPVPPPSLSVAYHAPLGPISNFNTSGSILVKTLPNGKHEATANLRLERVNGNYGTLSTSSWVSLGTLIPEGSRFTTVAWFYTIGFVAHSTVSLATAPVSVYVDWSAGGISIKGTHGLTTVINVSDFITLYATAVED